MRESDAIKACGAEAWLHLLGEPATRRGDTWSWPCFMHDDREPSFHVNVAKGLANCSPCQKGGDIFWLAHRKWNLNMQSDFREIVTRLAKELHINVEDEARKDKRLGKFIPWDQRQGMEAVYQYTDETGALLYEKAKFVTSDGKKTFEQRAKTTGGGYTYSTKGIRRVPYLLHLFATNKLPVIVVEGEKDADRIAKHGLLVTTTPDGSGVWRQEWNEFFRDREVLIIPDNDEPGEKHCKLVAGELAPVASELRIWRTTSAKWDAPKGADISDFLNSVAGGDEKLELELLNNLWDRAQVVDPHEAALKGLEELGISVDTTEDILAQEDVEIQHVWGQVTPVAGFSIVAAGPGVGKSTFSRCLAIAVSRGEEFAGYDTLRGPVLLFYLEEDRSQVRLHLKKLGLAKGDKVYVPEIENREHAQQALEKLVRTLRPVLVVIDPMQEFLGLREINSYTECYDRLHPVREVARETGTHIMMLHHTSKANSWILGSQAIKGSIDSSFILTKEEGGARMLACDKIRLGHPFEPMVLEFDPILCKITAGVNADEHMDKVLVQKAHDYILAENRKISRGELVEALGGDFKVISRALARNVGGLLVKKTTGTTCTYDVIHVEHPRDGEITRNPDWHDEKEAF